jgi:hypothetical protein
MVCGKSTGNASGDCYLNFTRMLRSFLCFLAILISLYGWTQPPAAELQSIFQVPYRKGAQWCYTNWEATVYTSFYDSVSLPTDKLYSRFVFSKGSRGLLDPMSGALLIPPVYASIRVVERHDQQVYFIAHAQLHQGLYDRSGGLLLDTLYREIIAPYYGFPLFELHLPDGKMGVYDADESRMVIPVEMDTIAHTYDYDSLTDYQQQGYVYLAVCGKHIFLYTEAGNCTEIMRMPPESLSITGYLDESFSRLYRSYPMEGFAPGIIPGSGSRRKFRSPGNIRYVRSSRKIYQATLPSELASQQSVYVIESTGKIPRYGLEMTDTVTRKIVQIVEPIYTEAPRFYHPDPWIYFVLLKNDAGYHVLHYNKGRWEDYNTGGNRWYKQHFFWRENGFVGMVTASDQIHVLPAIYEEIWPVYEVSAAQNSARSAVFRVVHTLENGCRQVDYVNSCGTKYYE